MPDPGGLAPDPAAVDVLRRVLGAREALASLDQIRFGWHDSSGSAAGAVARLVAADILAVREAPGAGPPEFIGFTQEGIAMAGFVGLLDEQPLLRAIWERTELPEHSHSQTQAERPEQPLAVRWALRLPAGDEESTLSGWTVLEALNEREGDPVVDLAEIQQALAAHTDIEASYTAIADVVTRMTDSGALERVDGGWRPILARSVGERTLERLVVDQPDPAQTTFPNPGREQVPDAPPNEQEENEESRD
jgi:hypothetical protein